MYDFVYNLRSNKYHNFIEDYKKCWKNLNFKIFLRKNVWENSVLIILRHIMISILFTNVK